MNFAKSLALIIFLTILAFLPTLTANFLNWDDHAHILSNPLVQQFKSVGDIATIFTTPDSANKTYQPLTTLSWAIEYKLFGKNPLVFHLSNLFWHLLVVVAVFVLARLLKLSLLGATLATIIFAIHPSRVENVAWVTARKDLMYGFFYILSLICYWIYLDKKEKKNDKETLLFFALALVAGVLSICSKAMALSLPWVLWLMDWFRQRKFSLSLIVDKIPFFLLIEPLAWLTFDQNKRDIVLNFPNGLLVWFWSAAFYITKFLSPMQMSPVYAMPEPVQITHWPYALSLIIIGITLFVCWRFFHIRWLIMALAFYFLTSFFLWRFDWRDISVVADRFLYIPSVMACFALGVFYDHCSSINNKIKQYALGVMVFLIISLGISSFVYSFAWRDGLSLWDSVTQNADEMAFAYNNRGAMYAQEGKKELAMNDFEKALQIASKDRVIKENGQRLLPTKAASQYASSHYNIGLIFAKEKKYDDALKHFNLAIYYEPEKPEYFNNRAVTFVKLNKMTEALNDYNASLALNPSFYETRLNRGLYFYKVGKKMEALEDFKQAIILDSRNEEGYMQAGRIYFENKDYAQAKDMFQKALKLNEDNAQALFNLGVISLNNGDKKVAQDYFSKAQLKWYKNPDKYHLPGLNPNEAKLWQKRQGN